MFDIEVLKNENHGIYAEGRSRGKAVWPEAGGAEGSQVAS